MSGTHTPISDVSKLHKHTLTEDFQQDSIHFSTFCTTLAGVWEDFSTSCSAACSIFVLSFFDLFLSPSMLCPHAHLPPLSSLCRRWGEQMWTTVQPRPWTFFESSQPNKIYIFWSGWLVLFLSLNLQLYWHDQIKEKCPQKSLEKSSDSYWKLQIPNKYCGSKVKNNFSVSKSLGSGNVTKVPATKDSLFVRGTDDLIPTNASYY